MEKCKNPIFFSTICFIIVITLIFFLFGSKDEKYYIERMVNFLQGYGIEAANIPIERVLVTIPDKFDDVYENYNVLQKKAGFDLEKYRGKNVWRYTFRVLNFDKDSNIRANLLVYNNEIIGGDVMMFFGYAVFFVI